MVNTFTRHGLDTHGGFYFINDFQRILQDANGAQPELGRSIETVDYFHLPSENGLRVNYPLQCNYNFAFMYSHGRIVAKSVCIRFSLRLCMFC